MSTKNINQAEQETGVSKRNIRFYEKEGLITPKRNLLNAYREYTEEDIRQIKMIKMFRMLDMPLEQIKMILQGTETISDAAVKQKKLLKVRAAQLSAAIRFCEELESESDDLDVDACLMKMESQQKGGYFMKWVEDYKKVAKAEHELRFTFMPDIAITKASEFTEALLQYAQENKLDLVIQKEGMYPEFTIDGIEYEAERNYIAVRGIPVAVVSCRAKHPELFETGVKEGRRKIQRKLFFTITFVLLVLFFAIPFFVNGGGVFEHSVESYVVLAGMIITAWASIFRFDFFFFNENGKKGKERK